MGLFYWFPQGFACFLLVFLFVLHLLLLLIEWKVGYYMCEKYCILIFLSSYLKPAAGNLSYEFVKLRMGILICFGARL